jgi:hypothetical protein
MQTTINTLYYLKSREGLEMGKRRRKRKRGVTLNLKIVVNANPEVEQFSIHDPQGPFSIAKGHSSAAASEQGQATAESGDHSPAQTDVDEANDVRSADTDNEAQATSLNENENENAGRNNNNKPKRKRGRKRNRRIRRFHRVIKLSF